MTKGLNVDDLISTTTFLVDLRDFGVKFFEEPVCDVVDEFNSFREQPENAFFNDEQINKLKNMERNEYLKNKTNKVNTFVEFSGRQTGKTTRLIQRALLESYQNNVVIFVNKLSTSKIISDLISQKLLFDTFDINSNNYRKNKNIIPDMCSKSGMRFYNQLSDRYIFVYYSFSQFISLGRGQYSFFFEEAAHNSNLEFLSHKEILENIAPNGLLYFSTTLKTFLQKKTAKLPDFHEDPMQFLYEEFGIDVNLKNKLSSNIDWVDEDQRRLEEGYLFKTVGQTTYE